MTKKPKITIIFVCRKCRYEFDMPTPIPFQVHCPICGSWETERKAV